MDIIGIIDTNCSTVRATFSIIFGDIGDIFGDIGDILGTFLTTFWYHLP